MIFFDVPNWSNYYFKIMLLVLKNNSCCDESDGISTCDKVLKVKFIIIYYCFVG